MYSDGWTSSNWVLGILELCGEPLQMRPSNFVTELQCIYGRAHVPIDTTYIFCAKHLHCRCALVRQSRA